MDARLVVLDITTSAPLMCVAMNVKEFLRSTDKAERECVAKRANTTVAYLFQLAGNFSRPSADMCVRLESASDGRMTREDLRPDLFLRRSA